MREIPADKSKSPLYVSLNTTKRGVFVNVNRMSKRALIKILTGATAVSTGLVLVPFDSASAKTLDMCVSTNGVERVQRGTAECSSGGRGSVAIAKGVEATAVAGLGFGNKAFAFGDGSSAKAGGGDRNTARVIGDNSQAEAGTYGETKSSGNTAVVIGNNSTASAGDGNNNTAKVKGDGSSARAGTGNNNTAIVEGNGSHAVALVGDGLSASVYGDGSCSIRFGLPNGNVYSYDGLNGGGPIFNGIQVCS